jgi:peptidoglycan/LPS O-acetylase OafA/YrhL
VRTAIRPGGELPALTSIRFFAALTVALSHFTRLGLLNLPAAFLAFVDVGRPAVSLFFVLSGFILTYKYQGSMDAGGASRFYVARFARIYPVMLLSLLIAMAVTIYLLRTDNSTLVLDWYALKSNVFASLVASLVAQLLLLTGWFPFASINQPWNGPAWSISCEAFFYALFPWLLRKLGSKTLSNVALMCASAWILQGIWIVSVAHCLPIGRAGFVISQFPLTHLTEFVMGIGCALFFIHVRSTGRSSHRFGFALVSTALLAIALLAAFHLVKPAYYLESPFFAVLILGLALLERPVLGLLNTRPLVVLGEASFSLYLIHVPLAHLAHIAGLHRDNGWVALLVAVGLSVLVFRHFEEPMRKRIRYGIAPARQATASTAS